MVRLNWPGRLANAVSDIQAHLAAVEFSHAGSGFR